MEMKQAVWIVGGLVGFLLVVGMGWSVGQILSISPNMISLEKRLIAVEETSDRTNAKLKVGAVLVNELGNRLQNDQEIKNQIENFNAQLKKVSDDFALKRISEEQATAETQRISLEYAKFTEDNLLRPIQTAVNQIASSGNYDLVVKVEDVVLFSKTSTMEDITEQVWKQIQANRGR